MATSELDQKALWRKENQEALKAITEVITTGGIRVSNWLKRHPNDELQVLIDHLPYGHMHGSMEEMGLYLKKYFCIDNNVPHVGMTPDFEQFETVKTMMLYLELLTDDLEYEHERVMERIRDQDADDLAGAQHLIQTTVLYRSLFYCFTGHIFAVTAAATMFLVEDPQNAPSIRDAISKAFVKFYAFMRLGSNPYL